MTTEALKYTLELANDQRVVIISMYSENGNITDVQFDQNRLEKNEVDKLLDFARNGSPEISVVKTFEPGPSWV